MTVEIIPAQPGYYLLTVIYADDGSPNEIRKTPVIAWRILSGGTPYPVGDEHNLMDAVMRPDGSVYIPAERFGQGMQFENEVATLQHFTDEHRRYTEKT